ncbi:MAG: DUF938 domain-containing protein [Burkholderiales bacterium]|nr:DUF938 domain-containing protein [Burkholderiales bacterium]
MDPQRGGVLSRATASAAERNKEPILEVLARVLPASGTVLEIASGTGQHVVHFARALPALQWQPSDPDAGARHSVRAWVAQEGLANVREPIDLDVNVEPWPVASAAALVCINMIHIAPWEAARGLMRGAGRILAAGGVLVLYGPYRRGGQHTAPSNEAFDSDLRARDPSWGVRDLEAVETLATGEGFTLDEVVPMPANNLSLVFRKGERAGPARDLLSA